MDPFLERIYIDEIIWQISAAIRSIKGLNDALAAGHVGAVHDHTGDFLNHLGVVSKILKPSNKDPNSPERRRGRYLRTKLKIRDDCPVLDRELRNLLEHIDEQIDEWAKNAKSNNNIYVDKNLGDISAIRVEGVAPEFYMMRNYDPVLKEYTVRTKKFDLQELAESAIETLNSSTKRAAVLIGGSDQHESRQAEELERIRQGLNRDGIPVPIGLGPAASIVREIIAQQYVMPIRVRGAIFDLIYPIIGYSFVWGFTKEPVLIALKQLNSYMEKEADEHSMLHRFIWMTQRAIQALENDKSSE